MYSGQKVAHKETNVAVKYIVLIRSAVIILGAYIYGKSDGVNFSWSTIRQFPYHVQKSLFLRSFYGFAAIAGAMIAIKLCPVSVAVSIMMM